jgi:hypothetical protein
MLAVDCSLLNREYILMNAKMKYIYIQRTDAYVTKTITVYKSDRQNVGLN